MTSIAGNDEEFRKRTIDHIETTFDKISRQPTNDVIFLGMHIKKNPNGDISVDQNNYITEMLLQHNITTSSITPASTNIHAKLRHAAYPRRDVNRPFTVGHAMLDDTYDNLEGDNNASAASNMQLRSAAGSTTTAGTALPTTSELTTGVPRNRKRPPSTLLEKAAKIRQDAEMTLLTRYNDAARLIFAQIRYHLSDAAATTLEANAEWIEAQLHNDLVRAWHAFIEVALSPRRSCRGG